jgi:hypothetical protein
MRRSFLVALLLAMRNSLANQHRRLNMATKKNGSKVSRNALAVGNQVFIRTVTHYYTGRVVELSTSEVVLEEAAWIADTDRFAAALATGNLKEVEPFPGDATIGRGAIVDACTWPHALPRSVK